MKVFLKRISLTSSNDENSCEKKGLPKKPEGVNYKRARSFRYSIAFQMSNVKPKPPHRFST